MIFSLDDIECRCPCHSNPGFRHVRACCTKCQICGKRLVLGMDEHLQRHVEQLREEASK